MGRVEGKVALVTGAARGQGRSHAVRLAEEGASVIAIDICEDIGTVPYALSTEEDLAETAREIEKRDQRVVTVKADVRDEAAMREAVDRGVAELGRLDIVSANAGIFSCAPGELDGQTWKDMIDVNLNGVFHTCKAAVPHLRRAGGGSVVLTSSCAGLMGFEGFAHYTAAKHGVIGYMRSLAKEVANDFIRVNTVCPTSVFTDMINNDAMFGIMRPDLESPTVEDAMVSWTAINLLPVPYVDVEDITNAVLFLASDEARYITSVALPVDAGSTQK
ncbi:mycofactocin-coupled SDR family oxidoreductase [Pseudonocardia pini]|uniref:mycofactocin-coupled SDR family oxidoreductase n=1 Tax=Pseudonocardia pini TaxID=2758030 RepID=UPI0015F0BA51|nr:mycofactocin-coupled SDR family oxidoreductase [Pseudonocardia pini]